MKPRRALWGVVLAVALGLSITAIMPEPEISSRTHTALAYVVPVLAYVGGLWLQHALTPRNGARRRSLIRGAAIPAALGALGSFALLAAAALLWGLCGTEIVWGSGTGELATWELVGTASVTMITALVVVSLIRVPTTVGRRWAMSAMKNQPRGEGRPVLMLRTFGDDTVKLRVRRPDRAGFLDSLLMKRRERFEELVALMLSSYGPPIAVGQPGQVLAPGLGAQRFTFSGDT